MGGTVASVGSNGAEAWRKARLEGRAAVWRDKTRGRRCRFHSMSAGGTLKGVLRLAEA